jgi:hypothetical protein
MNLRILRVLVFIAAVSQLLSIALFSAEGEALSLFTISELSGSEVMYVEDGKILPRPAISETKVSTQQFIQVRFDDTEGTKYFVTHNNGTDEVVMLPMEGALCFLSATTRMHAVITICLNRVNPDGSFLVLYTQTRPDFLGKFTTTNVFHGSAKPAPLWAAYSAWLDKQRQSSQQATPSIK